MLIIKGYVVLVFAIGFILATSSRSFKGLSLWKQIIVLSISPLLLAREIFYDFKKEVRKWILEKNPHR